MERVSIIMPVYNCEKYISIAINSVLDQSYSNWELIIIDDGSKDKSGYICDTYASRDSRIIVKHVSNGGVAKARNFGLKIAGGKFVHFLDSDDYISPNFLETMIKAIGGNDLAVCSVLTFPCNNIREYPDRVYSNLDDTAEDFETLYNNSFYNLPTNKLYIRALIDFEFPEDISLGEDLLFNLNYMKKCKGIRCVAEALFNYRILNDGSLSTKFPDNMFWIEEQIVETYQKSFRNYHSICAMVSNQRIELLTYKIMQYLKKNNSSLQDVRRFVKECSGSRIFSADFLDEKWCHNLKCKIVWKALRSQCSCFLFVLMWFMKE